MWNGRDLMEVYSRDSTKLACKLARAIKKDQLRLFCMTADGEQSTNSTFPPWPVQEMTIFRKVIMRKCVIDGERYAKNLATYVEKVNGAARYEHNKWLESQDIERGTIEAFKNSRCARKFFYEKKTDVKTSGSASKNKRVSFPASPEKLDDDIIHVNATTSSLAGDHSSTQFPSATPPSRSRYGLQLEITDYFRCAQAKEHWSKHHRCNKQ